MYRILPHRLLSDEVDTQTDCVRVKCGVPTHRHTLTDCITDASRLARLSEVYCYQGAYRSWKVIELGKSWKINQMVATFLICVHVFGLYTHYYCPLSDSVRLVRYPLDYTVWKDMENRHKWSWKVMENDFQCSVCTLCYRKRCIKCCLLPLISDETLC